MGRGENKNFAYEQCGTSLNNFKIVMPNRYAEAHSLSIKFTIAFIIKGFVKMVQARSPSANPS